MNYDVAMPSVWGGGEEDLRVTVIDSRRTLAIWSMWKGGMVIVRESHHDPG